MTRKSSQNSTTNIEQLTLNMNIVAREPGVKAYRPMPTQAEVRKDSFTSQMKRNQDETENTGYGPVEKFYKPEDKRIPDQSTAEWLRMTKKTFGRPYGKYNPATIITQDIIKLMPNTHNYVRIESNESISGIMSKF